jgi:hydrogenase maturation protease
MKRHTDKPPKPLILCLGNADRGDDALGPCCADRLEKAGVPAHCSSGEAFSLLESFKDHPFVIIVDAVVTGSCPVGHIHRWEGVPAGIDTAAKASTHGFGLAEALRLAEKLRVLPNRLIIFGVEASNFEWGSSPSPEITAALDPLVAAILADSIR